MKASLMAFDPLMSIHIKDIRVETVIGVYEWEKKQRQPLLLNIHIDYDAIKAAETDDVAHVLDYCELTKDLVSYVQSHTFELIETLAHKILAYVLEHPAALKVQVEIDKPEALKDYARSVSVTAHASRQQ